jgi:hypothetical protein
MLLTYNILTLDGPMRILYARVTLTAVNGDVVYQSDPD